MLRKILRALFSRSAAGVPDTASLFRFPGIPEVADGNTAVILVEREAADASGAHATAPTTQISDYWEDAVAAGYINVSGRPLIQVRPESEHAAAGIVAGMAMTGLRATNFSSGPGMAFMHESLYAAAGKRLPYVINMGCRALTKASLSLHAAHDDYHAVGDTGFIQLLAKNAQEAADMNLIARKTAELALTPAIVGQDGLNTTHGIESLRVPERELIETYLGRPEDMIDTPTPAQRMLYGHKRRRVPSLWDVDNPLVSGSVQNQDAYMQATVAQRPYFFGHIEEIVDRCMDEYAELTGRRYARIGQYRTEDADYLIVGMGSMIVLAEAVADYLRKEQGIRVGVVNITMFRPFPGDLLSHVIQGKKGVAILERTDQPLAEDLPLMREVRAAIAKCVENAGCGEDFRHQGYAAYAHAGDLPPLFSGCYGLGSRDLQPQALIAAVSNMLPEGGKRKFFYLSVDFVRRTADGLPNEAGTTVLAAYPQIEALTLPMGQDPNLLPEEAVTIRLHFAGGDGAVSAGKDLAGTIARLTGWNIKGNAQRESEMTGQPGSYQLAVAPQPIRIDCEYLEVDVVMSSDPCVQRHSDPLTGLRKGGALILQSALATPAAVWDSFPVREQTEIIDNDIQLFYLDALKIAGEETTSEDRLSAIQGMVFQGAFFAASSFLAERGIAEAGLFKAVGEQLQNRLGQGELAERCLRAFQRGFFELTEIGQKTIGFGRKISDKREATMPIMLHHLPGHTPTPHAAHGPDVRRFWERTGSYYANRGESDNVADPFITSSLMPAATGIFRDMTGIRTEHPEWLADKCTGCGDCYLACPDTAIPGLVSRFADVVETVARKVEAGGRKTEYLRRSIRPLEKAFRQQLAKERDVTKALRAARESVLAGSAELERSAMAVEFAAMEAAIGNFQWALTPAYWDEPEGSKPSSGGLFSITINPNACKGCGVCVGACQEGALKTVAQTSESVATLRQNWEFWLNLPTTPGEFCRAPQSSDRTFALQAVMLDKKTYGATDGVDGACRGCGEKSALHLFTSTVAALMQPRVEAFVGKLDSLIGGLETSVGMKLTAAVDVSNTGALLSAVSELAGREATLADLSAHVTEGKQPALDSDSIKRAVALIGTLKDLRQRYVGGTASKGRCHMGAVHATGCTTMWGATFPYNPYPFPWTSHLFQDSPSVALGIFEGHMVKMADAFKAVRRAELELAGNGAADEEFFQRFDWQQFSDEEWALCPPVVATGGSDVMSENGFQNLSRALMSGKPLKILVLDTQSRSSVAAQSNHSLDGNLVARHGFGPERKEIALLAMAHRAAFVLQSTVAHTAHLVQGYVDGLNSRRPALFNIYAACPPKHGVGDKAMIEQARLAVESRAFPLFRYDPDAAIAFTEAVSLAGNPDLERDWPQYTLIGKDAQGNPQTEQLALTFADFAATERRFARYFEKAAPESWNDKMVALADFLKLPAGEREGLHPYICSLGADQRFERLMVAEEVVRICEDRLSFWNQIKELAGLQKEEDSPSVIAERVRKELLTAVMAELGAPFVSASAGAPATAPAQAVVSAPASTAAGHDVVSIDSAECSACDECIALAPGAFAYNGDKQAIVVNPIGAKFADFVKAAEKCNAGCIRPGTPWNPAEADLSKWVVRAERFN